MAKQDSCGQAQLHSVAEPDSTPCQLHAMWLSQTPHHVALLQMVNFLSNVPNVPIPAYKPGCQSQTPHPLPLPIKPVTTPSIPTYKSPFAGQRYTSLSIRQSEIPATKWSSGAATPTSNFDHAHYVTSQGVHMYVGRRRMPWIPPR